MDEKDLKELIYAIESGSDWIYDKQRTQRTNGKRIIFYRNRNETLEVMDMVIGYWFKHQEIPCT